MTFSLEAIVSCDDRGQLVLPKDLRKKLNITSGQKLALMELSHEGKRVIALVKAEALGQAIKGYMTPVVKGIIK